MTSKIVWKFNLSNERCLIGTISSIPEDAILCFSMMVPIKPVSGCSPVRNVGGYSELSFPAGSGAKPFSIEFEEEEFKVFNAGWLPWNPYVRFQTVLVWMSR